MKGIVGRKGFLIIFLLLFLPAMTGTSRAGEMIRAEGVAAIVGGNAVSARAKAIDDALRKAVEQAVGTIISSGTMTRNYTLVHDKILAKTAGFIERYTIVSEDREGDLYRVTIQAEVGRTNLMDDLSALGLLHALKEKPKVMVIIDEKMGLMYGAEAAERVGLAESAIMEKLINAGFNVVDPSTVRANISRDRELRMLEGDARASAAEGLKYEAQVVITGKAFSKNAGNVRGSGMLSIQATIQARVIRTDTAKVIASRNASAAQVHIDELRGGALAIKEASETLADDLIADITKQWSGEVYGSSQEITVMISGLKSYNHLAAIKRVLENEIQGVKAVNQRSFTGGVAELSLDYGGKSEHVAEELANRKFPGFRLDPTNVTPNRVDLKSVPEKKSR